MSSEDIPLLSPTLSTLFIMLHEALQVSAGKVDLIHMIGCTCAIEMGGSSVPACSVPVTGNVHSLAGLSTERARYF